MPDFDFPEFTDWTLYISAPYSEDDKYIICTFYPSSIVQVPTSLTAGIQDLWDKVIGANIHTEPFNFLVSEGLDLVLPASTVLPKISGIGSETLLDKYIIDSIHPGGFIPLFVTAVFYPNSFRHERFEIVYIIEGEDTENFAPEGHESSAETINGEDYWLFRPPVSGWMGTPEGEEMIAQDGNYYYDEFEPHYPLTGVCWVKIGFGFAYFHQPSAFWGEMDEDWEFYTFPWGKVEAPTRMLFYSDLSAHFWLDSSVFQRWILGDTPAERSDEYDALMVTFRNGFQAPWHDNSQGTMDRFTWYSYECEFPNDEFRMNIHFKDIPPPQGHPDWWRVYYKARYYGAGTIPETSLFIRKKGPEVPAHMPVGALLALLATSPVWGSRFPLSER